MILYVGVFYSNVKPMETITTVLREVVYSRHILLLNAYNNW